MSTVITLAAGAGSIAVADLWLAVICWRRRTVLGGVASTTVLALVGFAIASGLRGSAARSALVIAAVFLLVGIVLYWLGQGFERLLDDEPEDGR
ncbi:MAG: hypothetical protein ACLP50_12970 [Solirubrobacteraceae bacterium]